ncbi:UNVERIFIED_CONTAM: Gibberellin 2-beta-dioxygenase 6 [Sesamum radiatum]|uniref:Gibberellin 2-beta-dioxygenase 6 n=1 Tax=Sesamum radiatum TaxID=300843 RepID=A0AAW2TJU6_SESRA
MTYSISDNFRSYPPLFRPNPGVDPGDEHYSPNPEPDSDSESEIPVVDLGSSMSPAQNLSKICREWGMFRLVNHGVPMELLTRLHEHANKLFSLDFEAKQALITTPILYFWGSPALSMSGNVQQRGPCADSLNWLEGLNVPLANNLEFEYDNPLLQSFRSLLEEYGKHQTRLAKTIFSVMAKDLSFPPSKSKSYLSLPTGFLRVYRYLRCPMADRRWGIDSHTDSSVLSILHQDQVGGLQVYKNDKWLDVKPIHNTLIVNLGDMMQAMSNDNYISVKHRVRVNKEKERISIGYFVFPAKDAVIESSRYKPFTYPEFQAAKELDLKTVGVKIGL